MIEIPEGAQYFVQRSGRVDISLMPWHVVEFRGIAVRNGMVFRKVDRWWSVFVVGDSGAWESFRVEEQDIPDVVKDML